MKTTSSSPGRWWTAPLRAARRIAWAPPLLLRVILGITFIGAGWGKLHALDGVIAYFDSLGIPAASIQAPFVASVELVGGLLILVGFGTRIAAALLAGVMGVAIGTAIWPGVSGLRALLGSVEAVYLGTFVYLAVHGPGAIPLDHLAARRFPALQTLTQEN